MGIFVDGSRKCCNDCCGGEYFDMIRAHDFDT